MFFIKKNVFFVICVTCVFLNEMSSAENITSFFPEVKGNLTRVTWAHAVNNLTLLTSTLNNSNIMMIEADVVLGKLNGNEAIIPIMAHPPKNTSDLSLETFLQRITEFNTNLTNPSDVTSPVNIAGGSNNTNTSNSTSSINSTDVSVVGTNGTEFNNVTDTNNSTGSSNGTDVTVAGTNGTIIGNNTSFDNSTESNNGTMTASRTVFRIETANKNGTLGRKGVKLDFKTIEAFNRSLDIIKQYNKVSFPVWLNADILPGPVNLTVVPVNAAQFLSQAKLITNAALSLGWTTFVTNGTGSYTNVQIDDMIKTINSHNVTNEITFAVRSALAAESLPQMKKLLTGIPGSTLTLWSAETDKVNVQKLRSLVANIGVSKLFIDVPDNLMKELHLDNLPKPGPSPNPNMASLTTKVSEVILLFSKSSITIQQFCGSSQCLRRPITTTMGFSKRSLLLAVLLCPLAPIFCQNITAIPNSQNSTTDPTPQSPPNYDYLVKLLFNIQETKVPAFLIDTIYTNSSAKSIAVNDVLQLFGIGNLSLPSTTDALTALDIQPEKVLSMTGLETFLNELNINFREFYTQIFSVKLNISGIALRNFIIALSIDEKEFSSAMSYNDPDPLEEFKKGNFSRASLESALNGTGNTVEDLFVACREELFFKARNLETEEVVGILTRYNFAQTQVNKLWKYLNLTMNDVYNISVFSNILEDTIVKLNENSYLGVVLSQRSIAINKKVYETWKGQTISKMFAQTIDNSSTLKIEEKLLSPDFDNIVILKTNGTYDNSSIVQWAATAEDLKNCIFITLENDSVIMENIEDAKNVYPYFEVRSNVSRTDLVLGSPLVCQNIVYGLAREVQEMNSVIFDAFAKLPYSSSGLTNIVFSRYLVFLTILGCYSM
ncbi:hypothetical protein JTB14_010679 [Gonioctena quinquepunctata]|nr:hypothetical protein JTB14_010679 [Gonioctena quinquepunctata]